MVILIIVIIIIIIIIIITIIIIVQNPKYWTAKECARLQNKTQLTRKV